MLAKGRRRAGGSDGGFRKPHGNSNGRVVAVGCIVNGWEEIDRLGLGVLGDLMKAEDRSPNKARSIKYFAPFIAAFCR